MVPANCGFLTGVVVAEILHFVQDDKREDMGDLG